MSKKAVLVYGPHRSGTSLVSKAMGLSGFTHSNRLLVANDDNKAGFFESEQVVSLNDLILREYGICWDFVGIVEPGDVSAYAAGRDPFRKSAQDILRREFPEHVDIVLKDPRFCFLAPFWRQILDEQGFTIHEVLALRDPLESAASQRARYLKQGNAHMLGADLNEGGWLWATYLSAALKALEGREVYLTSYERFLEQPNATLDGIKHWLHLGQDTGNDGAPVAEVVDPLLSRQRAATLEETGVPDFISALRAIHQEILRYADDNVQSADARRKPLERLRAILCGFPHELSDLYARLYVRARNKAVATVVRLAESESELAHATSIIRYNEYLIDRLEGSSEKGESKDDE